MVWWQVQAGCVGRQERCELGAPTGVWLTPTPGGAALTQPQLCLRSSLGPKLGISVWDLSVPSGAMK